MSRPTLPDDEFIGRLTRAGSATDDGGHAADDPELEREILGLLQRDEHRVDPMRHRWLRSWVSGSPSGAGIRLLDTIWASQWFYPFLTYELANSAINTDKDKVFVRLSSSVPGHVTVSFWNPRSRQPHHVRIGPIFEDGRLMFEGRRHGIEDIIDYITNRNSSDDSSDGTTNATTCPVCKDTMHGKRTLVSVCGHSFCQECIHGFWDFGGRSCPLCRAGWNECPRRQSIIGQISPRSKISPYACWIPMDNEVVAAERVRLGLSHVTAADFPSETQSTDSEDLSDAPGSEYDSSACYSSGPELVPPPAAGRPGAGNVAADGDGDGSGERAPTPRLPHPALQSWLLYAGIVAGFAAMLALRLKAS